MPCSRRSGHRHVSAQIAHCTNGPKPAIVRRQLLLPTTHRTPANAQASGTVPAHHAKMNVLVRNAAPDKSRRTRAWSHPVRPRDLDCRGVDVSLLRGCGRVHRGLCCGKLGRIWCALPSRSRLHVLLVRQTITRYSPPAAPAEIASDPQRTELWNDNQARQWLFDVSGSTSLPQHCSSPALETSPGVTPPSPSVTRPSWRPRRGRGWGRKGEQMNCDGGPSWKELRR